MKLETAEEKGIKEGISRNNKEVAKKMKQKGIDISIISEITGLSKKEIEEL